MPNRVPRSRRWFFLLAFAAASWLGAVAPAPAEEVVLFTASTDNSGGVYPQSLPGDAAEGGNNPYLPPISPGVTLTPNPAFLDSKATGPLNGITYGPDAFGGNEGGTTGWVTTSYTIPTAGAYQLIWEVSDAIDHARPSALTIDNVRLGGNLLYGFESGIPAGFTPLGTIGTSGAITNLAPTQGSSFAFLDTTGNVPPIFDTVDGTAGSRLYSSVFNATAGQTLSMDLAFLTTDGGPFDDYGIAVLTPVPEPASLTLMLTAGAVLSACKGYRQARRARRPSPSR